MRPAPSPSRTTFAARLAGAALLVFLALAGCPGSDAPDPRVWRPPEPCPDGCCNDDYLSLPSALAEHARPVSDKELRRRLLALQSHETSEFRGRWTRRRLRRDLVREMNLQPFLAALDNQEAIVALGPPEEVAGVTRHAIRWTDPLVGAIEGLLLLPPPGGSAQRAAVVGVHGHNEDAEDFAREYGGYALARAGFVVALPTMRANGEGLCESQAAATLLRSGFSLVGVRLYEVLRVRQWLAARPDVASDRIGLFGHSGGAAVGNVAVRITDGFHAYVSDFVSDFAMVEDGPDGPMILDETSPALHPYRALLGDLSTLAVPGLLVPYESTKDAAGYALVEEFLLEQLVNRVDASPHPEPEDLD